MKLDRVLTVAGLLASTASAWGLEGGACIAEIQRYGSHERQDHPPLAMTVINVFTVEPVNQQELIDLLTRATEDAVRHAPGFISARLHREASGTKVAMVARWRSRQHYEAMRSDPRPVAFLQRALAIAKLEPGIYEVVRTFAPIP